MATYSQSMTLRPSTVQWQVRGHRHRETCNLHFFQK